MPRNINLRSDKNIFLVGKCASNILGAKLPSIKQVLQLLFYKMRIDNMTVMSSMKYTVGVTMEFWKKANIPTIHERSCVRKLKIVYEKWRKLQKNAGTLYEKHRKQEEEFCDEIQNFIFDIAAPDALEKIKIKEDKDFLEMQRRRGRPGVMNGVDTLLYKKRKRREKRLGEERKRSDIHKAKGILLISY